MATKTETEAWGTAQLAEHINKETGKDYDGYSVRILLRQLTKEGVIERGEGRYAFAGPRDKTVLAVVKAIKSGAADRAKQAKLDELKSRREKKDAAESPTPKATGRNRKAVVTDPVEEKPARRPRARKPAPVEADDDLDIDEI